LIRRLAAAAAALLLAAPAAFADLDVAARLGHDGRWVTEAATPLVLSMANTGAEPIEVKVVVEQGESFASRDIVHVRLVRIAATSRRDETFLVHGPRHWGAALQVRVEVAPVVPIHAGKVQTDRGTATFDVAGTGAVSSDEVPYESKIVGVVGDPGVRIATNGRRLGLNADDHRPCDRIEFLGLAPESLRLGPLGLEAFDAIVLCDPDARTLVDPTTAEALLDWVAMGGRLVVSLGEHASEFATSPLRGVLPATWTGAERRPYGPIAKALRARDGPEAYQGPWIELQPTDGADAGIPTAWEDGPLQVERSLGSGRIVVLPYDLRALMAAPWLKEDDARALIRPVASPPPRVRDDAEGSRRTEFTNAVGKILQTGAFEPPPLPLVVLGIVLYVVIVGPLDWFVLKRLKKERLTTLTFLGAVLAFTVLAYGASLLLFSAGARVNRVVFADLVDGGREGRQLLRFVDFAGYYSSTGADRSLDFAAPTVVLPTGLPGAQIGGVGTAMPVEVETESALDARALLRIAFRSQRIVRTVSATTLGATLDAEWDEQGGVRVVNGLPVDLDSVFVVLGDGVIELGRADSGETTSGGKYERQRRRLGASPAHFDLERIDRSATHAILQAMTLGPDGNEWRGERAVLRKAGLDRSEAVGPNRGLIVAHASKFPGALPGADEEGETYVVLRKEIQVP
jgi:hypothetical protein